MKTAIATGTAPTSAHAGVTARYSLKASPTDGNRLNLDRVRLLMKLFGLFDGTVKLLCPQMRVEAHSAQFDGSETLLSFRKKICFTTSVNRNNWHCRWVLPLDILECELCPSMKIPLNVGFYNTHADSWVSWVPSDELTAFGFMFSNVPEAGIMELMP